MLKFFDVRYFTEQKLCVCVCMCVCVCVYVCVCVCVCMLEFERVGERGRENHIQNTGFLQSIWLS